MTNRSRLAALALLVLLIGTALLQPLDCRAQQPQQEARKVKLRVTPSYPQLARELHVAGTVKMQVVVTPAGAVKSVTALGGHPLLIESAVDAVRRWKFEPGPTESTTFVEFRFTPGS